MTELGTVLENAVERELNTPDPNIAKFAQPRHRINMPGVGEFEQIKKNLHRLSNEYFEELRKLQALHDNMKVTMETLQRGLG